MKLCISKIGNGLKVFMIVSVITYVIIFGLLIPNTNSVGQSFGLWSAAAISLGLGTSFCLLKNNYKDW